MERDLIQIGDYVVRPTMSGEGWKEFEEKYYMTTLLSVNRAYKVIHVLDNGLLVLENFLCLIHPDSVIKISFEDALGMEA